MLKHFSYTYVCCVCARLHPILFSPNRNINENMINLASAHNHMSTIQNRKKTTTSGHNISIL